MRGAKATPNRHDIFDVTASGRDMRQRDAAHDRKHTRRKRPSLQGFTVYPNEGDSFDILTSGRITWALDRLLRAGLDGCTPLHNPAPRWSHYVHMLRQMGVEIETIQEPHGGDYPGHHGRYVLRSRVVREGGGA